ncbi:HPP family protein [Thiomicrospira sp. R3]|uniref:HPP family protein n=1 Tax=Thiomicrospira sp. R3 TaxID=3035472 RepID=UPI00259B2E1D|nr:HPP family protein [Thiomicrospira sp. R3]WFE69200.1 HPP family protein [Thiomicrospira sp. R3]
MVSFFKNYTSFERNTVKEVLVSTTGVFIALVMVILATRLTHHDNYPWFIIASIGASAIIIFSTPHAPMAQPWAVFIGQTIAALCGLTSWALIKDPSLAVAIAVTATLFFMQLSNARHAPGGATALFIALGPPEVQAYSWSILWLSLLPSLIALTLTAILFNWFFKWRRYPYLLMPKNTTKETQALPIQAEINHEDLVFATKQLEGYFEMTEEEFMDLYRLARQHHIDSINTSQKNCDIQLR